MKRTLSRVSALLLCLILVLSMAVGAGAVGEELPYSYFYGIYGNVVAAPDAYQVHTRIDTAELGLGSLKNATGLFVHGSDVYICDTGNDRILQLALSEKGPSFVRELREGDGWSLKAPEDVFVGEQGVFIADTGNRRVLHLDQAGKLIKEITAPTESPVFDATWDFKPQKLVMTAGGRLYVQASGVNKGLMEFSPEGAFEGYMGASPVRFDWEDYIWKLLATDAQREQMADFVPTEYNNVALDHEGFLFVTTSVFEAQDFRSAEPIRRLNLKGKNILVQTDPVIGDLNIDMTTGPSRFIDVTVMENEVYFALDSTRNRVFAYNAQGCLLYAFGGYGTRAGYFQSPKAIEHWGSDLLILDSVTGYLTVMRQTEYGRLIDTAISTYDVGDYEASNAAWEQVLSRNGHYWLAYDGIGKIRLRRGEYTEALEYLEYAKNGEYYSKAWKLYRKDQVEKYLIWVVVAIAVITVTTTAVKIVRREKEALEDYEALFDRGT